MIDWIQQIVSNLDYTGLVVLTFLENVFPPLPSEVIMPFAGFLVSRGQLLLVGVAVAGTLGSLIGALPLYYLGTKLSQERLERWMKRHGRWLLLTAGDIQQVFDWFEQHGTKAVFLARLVPGVRSLISIPAGACGMNLALFLLYTTLGTAIWTTALTYGGKMLGEEYQNLSRVLEWTSYAVVAILILSVLWWMIKRRQQQG